MTQQKRLRYSFAIEATAVVLFIALGLSTASAQTQVSGAVGLPATGFYLAGTPGAVLTAAHVVRGCGVIRGRRSDGSTATLTVVKADEQQDLALLRDPNGESPGALPLSDQLEPQLGEPVELFGFPVVGILQGRGTLAAGIVSGFGGMRIQPLRFDAQLIRVSMDLKAGFSGGPVIDHTGGLVAIASAAMELAPKNGHPDDLQRVDLNFAVGGNELKNFLDAQHLSYTRLSSTAPRPPTDIAAEAQRAALLITCTP